ncbi:sushi, von Willebrand factor type A, EGF and pentraxin domain-containing protein 1 [Lingula anatina]|uniref:Sushi, von Willebrand factor type A, EGF and pentraxin domain-containing protein 1 n=1 Tax=Lingula anatina TaxID=7574 RepID=A0A1S3HYA4_LINAN|nr:sushi, von Willebrand factor type A, EGF and pentraxin domain-containing protein 1 [Lingula anatina]|eukprot:XP_013391007.1 sushi, von Willebrand factor type A, EGF and pentraxin domain-containing protein 1 [Lingula anatina]
MYLQVIFKLFNSEKIRLIKTNSRIEEGVMHRYIPAIVIAVCTLWMCSCVTAEATDIKVARSVRFGYPDVVLLKSPKHEVTKVRKERAAAAIAMGVAAGVQAIVSIAGMIMGRKQAEEAAKRYEKSMKFQLEQLCDAICVTEWSEWSMCTARCGGGRTKRTREYQTVGRCRELQNFQCRHSKVQDYRCNENCPNGGTPNSGSCECQPGWKGSCCETEVVCDYPTKNPRSHIAGTWPAKYRSLATFTCDTGYHLAGRETIICGSDGKWSHPSPKCERIVCTMPQANEHVQILNPQKGYAFGEQLVYRCDEGYEIRGPETRVCQQDQETTGKFSGFNPLCEAVSCGEPGTPQHGEREGNSFKFGDVVTYKCNKGYKLEGQKSRRCMATKTWTGNDPTCVEIKCDEPRVPKHGEVIGRRVTFASKVSFQCDAGYNLVGNATLECLESGEWSAPSPTCEAAICGNPGSPVNGAKDGTVYYFPHNVTYSCFNGYILRGASKLTCQADGVWSGSAPTCEACPLNTYMAANSPICVPCAENTHTVTVASTSAEQCVCNKGYTGPPGGPCQEIRCPVLQAPRHGSISQCDNKLGSSCAFNCSDGYILDKGTAMRTCQENGDWDGAMPGCSACLRHTYKADLRSCLPCPRHSHTEGTARMKNGCLCDDGYQGPPGGPCTDIDECAPNDGRGPCQDTCENQDGRYRCLCSIQGYKIDPKDGHSCLVNETCRNLTESDAPDNGGLVCHWYREQNSQQCSVKCNPGFEFPSRTNDYETCGPMTDYVWTYQRENINSTLDPCIVEFFPDFKFEANSTYFVRACNELTEQERNDVKREFAKKLSDEGVCLKSSTKVCDMKNVGIICGRTTKRRRRRGVVEELQSVDFKFDVEANKGAGQTFTQRDRKNICIFLRIPDRHCEILGDKVFKTYKRFLKAAVMNAKRVLERLYRERLGALAFNAANRDFEPQQNGLDASGVETVCPKAMKASKENCVPCQAGSFYDAADDKCKPCPMGTYQPLARQTACVPCPTGSTTEAPGARICRMCPANKKGHLCQEDCDCMNGRCDPRNGECRCHSGWEGQRCEMDIPGCLAGSCFRNVTCYDVPAPGTGFRCGPCPPGFTGDGSLCHPLLLSTL